MFGVHVRPTLVRRLLAELDPSGSQRGIRKLRRRLRPQYNVAGPRSLYHCDAHEKLAHKWLIWFHGCVDGHSRKVIYLQARDNKRSAVVRDIYLDGMRREGWSSRTRWDKGSENVLAIREQVNRHLDQDVPASGARGSALTGRSIDNTRMEGQWRYTREQVTDQVDDCFEGMHRTSKVLNPDDPHHMFCLHAVFLHPMWHGDGECYSVIQRALDDMTGMWNEHPIRRR